MAAITASTSVVTVFGNKRIYTATLGSIADADTHVTGLHRIEAAFTQITDAAAAADALTVTAVTTGTLTFGVAGTISGAYVFAIGE